MPDSRWGGFRVGLLLTLLWCPLSAAAQCPPALGDAWPGSLDPTADPPVWFSEGDGRISLADALVAARAAVGLHETAWLQDPDCERRPADIAPGWLDGQEEPAFWYPWGGDGHDLADVIALLRAAQGRDRISDDLTWYKDTKVVTDDRCAGCHYTGGIGPFPLTAWDEIQPLVPWMEEAIAEREMPPWPPSRHCAEYKASRALSDRDYALMMSWIAQGARRGDPADEPPSREKPPAPEFDLRLTIEEPYTPRDGVQDDYRCFLVDWPFDGERYVTGMRTLPDKDPIVHHVIAYAVPPGFSLLAELKDAEEPGPGYECFGDSGLDVSYWLGAWAPGEAGRPYPAGTGIRVLPGSLVVIQIHYNMDSSPPLEDQTSVEFQVAEDVDRRAFVLPAAADGFFIPAGEEDVAHEESWRAGDLVPDALKLELGLGPEDPFGVYEVGLHMHLLGTETSTWITRSSAEEACLLDIHHWEFEWQGLYGLEEPVLVAPDDRLHLRCAWDNSPDNQPVVGGQQQDPRDVTWGDGSTDEMCLGIYYIAAP